MEDCSPSVGPKVRSPYLLVDGGTRRSLVLAERNARAGRYASSMSVMYEGAMPC